MSVKLFELFHGIILTKLVRSDRPITLRLIETKPGVAWSVYTINDEVDIFVKYSLKAQEQTREKNAISWQFIFSADQIQQLTDLRTRKQVFVALVCGRQNTKDTMQICFLEPSDLNRLIDFSLSSHQSLTVKYIPRKKLRVITKHQVELLVGQNALDEWIVPGS